MNFFFILLFSLFLTLPLRAQASEQLTSKKDSIQSIIDQANGIDKIDPMFALFDLLFPRDIKKCQELCIEMEHLALKYNNKNKLLKIWRNKGSIFKRELQLDSLHLVATKGVELAVQLEDQQALGGFYNFLGIYQEVGGSLDSALFFYNKALDTDFEDKYKIYANVGKIYTSKGDVFRAIEYMELAMLEAQKRGLINAQAVIANNIGGTYVNIDNIGKAEEYFLQSLELKEKIGDKRGKLFALVGLALNSQTQENRKKYSDLGKKIAEEIGDQTFGLMFTAQQAKNLYYDGKFQEGLDLLLPAYEAIENPKQLGLSRVYMVFIQLYTKLGKFQEAEEYGLKRFDLTLKAHANIDHLTSQFLLLSVYKAQKDFKKFFAIASEYIPLKDSIDAKVRLERFAMLEAQLDKEQKQKVDLLNLSVQQKERSRYWMGAIGLLTALLLLLMLYYRNQRIKAQKQTIEKEVETAKQLENMNSKLKELDEFKSRLYTNITHEFRTPLTVVLGMTEQLKSAESSTKLADVGKELSLISRNGKSLLDLINQILDLSKVENNQLKANYVQSDIIRYARYITESFHSLANANNVMLRVDSKHAEIFMDYDTEKFRQILSNLLSNAIKYTPSGGQVLISLKKEEAAQHLGMSYLKIIVTDTGPGISKEDIPNIFDRFYQADDSIAKAGGTGIGLALTKELVNLLDGSIEVESEVGKGSSFIVSLPIKQEAEIAATSYDLPVRSKVPESPLSRAAADHPSDLNILLIEDNPDVVEYLTACLKGQYHLDFAYNGRAGIEKALEIVPDLIISDVMMPEKDGFEVCDILKNDERTSHIPIILLTAKADVESRLAGLSRGADAYLGKPFHKEELLIRLQKLMDLRKRLQERYSAGYPKTNNAPQTPNSTSKLEDAFIKKLDSHIEKQLDDPDFGVPQLTRKMALSQSQLYRKIKALTNKSTAAYIRSYRLDKGKAMLQQKDLTISEVAYAVGFSSLQYFSDAFYKEFGQRPSEISD